MTCEQKLDNKQMTDLNGDHSVQDNMGEVVLTNYNIDIISLSSFIKQKYPKCIPIPLVKDTKFPLGGFVFAKDKISDEEMWDKWDKEGLRCVEQGNADVGLSLRGGVIVIDFDNKEWGTAMNEMEGFKDTVCVESDKGFHYYFETTDECKDWTTMVRPYGKKYDIDIIAVGQSGTGSIIVFPPSKGKRWVRPIGEYDILPMPKWFIDKHYQHTGNDDIVKVVSVKKTGERVEFEKLCKAVMGLNVARAEDFEDWRNVCFAIYNVSYENGYGEDGEDLIHQFSKQCKSKYSERSVDKFIRYARFRDDGFGMGSIMKWLKRDNPELFDELVVKPNVVEVKGYAFVQENKYDDLLNTKGKNYEEIKDTFELRNFKILKPVAFVEVESDDNITLRKKDEFTCRWENLRLYKRVETRFGIVDSNEEFVKSWLKDPTMRTYHKVDFYPCPSKCPSNIYNMWRGFAIERKKIEGEGEYQFAIDHLSVLCNHDQKGVDYVLKLLANIIQNPDTPAHIAVAFYSEKEGAGKNVFLDFFRKIIGFEDLTYETCDPEKDIFSRFSVARAFKLMVVVDETRAKSHFDYADFFKNYITSLTMNYEEKGVKGMTVNNFNNFFFTTNNMFAFKVNKSSRRYVLFKCSDEKVGNAEYFTELKAKMDDERNQLAFFNYLKGIDLSGVNWERDRPITEYYKSLQELCADSVLEFIKYFIGVCNVNSDGMCVVYGLELYNKFKEWAAERGRTVNMTDTAFKLMIKDKVVGIDKGKHTRHGETWYIYTDVVRKYLVNQGIMMDYDIDN